MAVRRFYRIIGDESPSIADFLSDAARGRPTPSDPALLRLRDGLSVYATLAQARRKARAYPMLGQFIAVLEIPETEAIRYERTLPGSRGHHTLWGEPKLLLACIVSVVKA